MVKTFDRSRFAADLLIRVGQDAVQHIIWRIELAVPKAAHERSRKQVGPRLGDRVHLHARGSALGRVEPVRDELEFGDRIVAVPRLVAGADIRRDLLAVDVELKLADIDPVLHGKCALRVGPVPGREQRERQEVAALRRQLLHLPLIDVAAQTRCRGLDERRLCGDDDRLLHRRRRHLQVDDGGLPDEQLEACARDRREPGDFGRQLVHADAHRHAVGPALIGEGFKAVAGRVVDRSNGDPRQNRARGVGHGAAEDRLLCKAGGGHRHHQAENDQSSHHEPWHWKPPSYRG